MSRLRAVPPALGEISQGYCSIMTRHYHKANDRIACRPFEVFAIPRDKSGGQSLITNNHSTLNSYR